MMLIAYLIIGCVYTYGTLMSIAGDIKEIYGDPLDLSTTLGLVLGIVICVAIWPLLLIADIVNFA